MIVWIKKKNVVSVVYKIHKIVHGINLHFISHAQHVSTIQYTFQFEFSAVQSFALTLPCNMEFSNGYFAVSRDGCNVLANTCLKLHFASMLTIVHSTASFDFQCLQLWLLCSVAVAKVHNIASICCLMHFSLFLRMLLLLLWYVCVCGDIHRNHIKKLLMVMGFCQLQASSERTTKIYMKWNKKRDKVIKLMAPHTTHAQLKTVIQDRRNPKPLWKNPFSTVPNPKVEEKCEYISAM